MEEYNNNLPEETEEVENNEEVEIIEEDIDEPKKSIVREILDWLLCIVIAVAIALVIRNYVFTLVNVSGPSMNPTLNDKDILYVNRLFYTPKAGDIIIFKPKASPETPYVKRIIATEGQIVELDYTTGGVIVDGKPIDEDYISEPIENFGNMEYPYTVPEDHVFAMGDNRNNSLDSRMAVVGAVSEESIIGKAIFRIFPIGDFGSLYE